MTSPVIPTIRPARPEDVPAIVAMVHELAEYERASDQCHLTAEQLTSALFPTVPGRGAAADAPSPTAAPALFGHVAVDEHDEPIGFALWFLNFSTWAGVHGIYLEDLYVSPAARGTGAGRLLLATLADICVRRGYRRLEWWMINWNPAAGFYASIGAEQMSEWIPYRLSGDALRQLANQATAAGTRTDDRPGRVPDRGDEA
ncbi:GNAT superfamily N-acetyltransferase [Micromonospora luteifusca]|uniref:GNAT superfamily N-acetyltransferase n=1 Tax=Micromonospora luteifusca TaxID=709860 RepID=A0ABS2LR43_9ACTN|nr:GNAT family N-acetyltransferase [Micromonospora luteifusca]MBM7490656.1 GNAT superfamily N-acetyltransferase [Micromonospora luteifusca]